MVLLVAEAPGVSLELLGDSGGIVSVTVINADMGEGPLCDGVLPSGGDVVRLSNGDTELATGVLAIAAKAAFIVELLASKE